ncbi:MAG: hypothetical protein AAF460_13340, partial [Pseudomonadota bacterium]
MAPSGAQVCACAELENEKSPKIPPATKMRSAVARWVNCIMDKVVNDDAKSLFAIALIVEPPT